MKQNCLFIIFALCFALNLSAQNADKTGKYVLKENIPYIDAKETDQYRRERCKLDVYYPVGKTNFTTVVWFHGGGLEGGEKEIPAQLKDKGIAVVAVNYRLSPKAQHPAYIEDAAQSVAWVFENIQSLGGNSKNIYISGHSAGGYLALMVALDKSYLAKYQIDADSIKGIIPVSGQTNTHYTIRKERGMPMDVPVVDGFAPLNKARKNIPPMLLITGDRRLEMTARYEENLLLETILKSMGNKETTLYELQGFDHGTVVAPACYLVLDWIKKYDKQ